MRTAAAIAAMLLAMTACSSEAPADGYARSDFVADVGARDGLTPDQAGCIWDAVSADYTVEQLRVIGRDGAATADPARVHVYSSAFSTCVVEPTMDRTSGDGAS